MMMIQERQQKSTKKKESRKGRFLWAIKQPKELNFSFGNKTFGSINPISKLNKTKKANYTLLNNVNK